MCFHSDLKTHFFTALITQICRISSLTALSLHLHAGLSHVQTPPQKTVTFLFGIALKCAGLSVFKDLKRRNFLSVRLPLRAPVQKLRRAAWRCVTSLLPPANPAMAVISPRQHPPPFPPLLHLSLCGWMMSSSQLPLCLTD